MSYSDRGFTFVEIIVVIGILATITGLAIVNLSGIQRRSYLSAQLQTIVADIKSQQLKAMNGDTGGSSAHNAFGVRFSSSGYTLFRGSSYNASDTSNAVVALEGNIAIADVTFPGSQVVFASGSGGLGTYTAGSTSFTLRNTIDSTEKTVTINRYGAITSIN